MGFPPAAQKVSGGVEEVPNRWSDIDDAEGAVEKSASMLPFFLDEGILLICVQVYGRSWPSLMRFTSRSSLLGSR